MIPYKSNAVEDALMEFRVGGKTNFGYLAPLRKHLGRQKFDILASLAFPRGYRQRGAGKADLTFAISPHGILDKQRMIRRWANKINKFCIGPRYHKHTDSMLIYYSFFEGLSRIGEEVPVHAHVLIKTNDQNKFIFTSESGDSLAETFWHQITEISPISKYTDVSPIFDNVGAIDYVTKHCHDTWHFDAMYWHSDKS